MDTQLFDAIKILGLNSYMATAKVCKVSGPESDIKKLISFLDENKFHDDTGEYVRESKKKHNKNWRAKHPAGYPIEFDDGITKTKVEFTNPNMLFIVINEPGGYLKLRSTKSERKIKNGLRNQL